MYENSIIHPKHITRINSNGNVEVFEPGTITVLDEFEKSNDNLFKITDNFMFSLHNMKYSINFIISKSECPKTIIKSNITLSEFKKIYTLPHYCKNLEKVTDCINHNIETFKLTHIPKISLPVFDFICTFKEIFIDNFPYNENNCNSIVKFPNLIGLNAQSSKDTRYGKYAWYGDTSMYAIIGYIVNNINSDQF